MAKFAARYGVPTFTHVRYLSTNEPNSTFEAFGELIALAGATGAHMHACHINSMALRDARDCVALLKDAQKRGLPVTVEAYPYGAASTTIGAETFRGEDWLARWGAPDASAMELNGQPLTQAKIDELQASAPGTVVVMHFLRPDDSKEDEALLDMTVLYPEGAIASDGIPWQTPAGLVEGDVWPLPEDAFAHPRSTGCYSRFLSRFVRERKAITLPDRVYRVKGILHLAERPDARCILQATGRRVSVTIGGAWDKEPASSRIVFIAARGVLDRASIEAQLAGPLAAQIGTGVLVA